MTQKFYMKRKPLPPERSFNIIRRQFNMIGQYGCVDQDQETIVQFLERLDGFLKENKLQKDQVSIYIQTEGDYYSGELILQWKTPESLDEFEKRQVVYQKQLTKYLEWEQKYAIEIKEYQQIEREKQLAFEEEGLAKNEKYLEKQKQELERAR